MAIVGKPNVGKSTLLNALLNEDRAIVSDIPGTTRDTIEDAISIEGILFRFIDTAGIRNSDNEIENYGIERTYKAAEKASVILYMADIASRNADDLFAEIDSFKKEANVGDKQFIVVANKSDLLDKDKSVELNDDIVLISAKEKDNINAITKRLVDSVKGGRQINDTLLSNARHYEAFLHILEAVTAVRNGIESALPGDLIMVDIRQALYYLGLITGQVSSDEILGTIFGRFCIGK